MAVVCEHSPSGQIKRKPQLKHKNAKAILLLLLSRERSDPRALHTSNIV